MVHSGGLPCGSTSERTWSTVGVPEPEQFEVWRAVVNEAFVPVSLATLEPERFASSVGARCVGPLGISKIDSQPQTVQRTASHIGRGAGDVYFLNLPLTDGSSASQGGRVATLAPGDFTIVDSAHPFELVFERQFQQVSVTVPHDLLAPLLAVPCDATALRVSGKSGVGALVSAAVRSLAEDSTPLDRHAARALADHIAGLVTLAVGTAGRSPKPSRALLLQAALDQIERTLDDPALCPASVAAHVGISIRYLHHLFADRGHTFSRWVLARRLERCHRDLGDPARSHWTVGELAIQHGFSDQSYFARAFRARYGLTPRQYRRLVRTTSELSGPALV